MDILNWDKLAPHKMPSAQAPKRDEPFPMDTLRALDLEAKVRVVRLVKEKLAWDNADILLSTKGGRFTFRHQSLRFYGGTYFLEFVGDARGTELKSTMELRIAGADAPPFLMDLGAID